MKNFFQEFKEFIAKGDAMDLAIGMVIGAAFTSIVNSIVNDLIMPLVSLIAGGVNFTNLEITIPNFFGTADAAHIRYGNLLQNIVTFIIVAFALFLVVRAINNMKKKTAAKLKKLEEKRGKDEEKDAEKEPELSHDEKIELLLSDIKTELKKSNKKSK
ncbi:large conductance mechanosensitive channel protein MscL [Candidatus Saccharibacteria bacterium]|nr:large conductance mechanosensitive channel protein MscL [Candidatus Saccharibacteria bacterium]